MKKNLIILHTDQQRFDSLGCNGNAYARTTNIDGLAAEGCNFTRHMASNPVCMPSRAGLLTGLNIPGHGVLSNGVPLWRRDHIGPVSDDMYSQRHGIHLMDKVPTLADMLAEHGYQTAMFGKLHLEPTLADEGYGFEDAVSLMSKKDRVFSEKPYFGFKDVAFVAGHGEAPCGYGGSHYGRWLQDNHPEVVKQLNDGSSDIFVSKVPVDLHNTSWIGNRVTDYIKAHDEASPLFMFVGFPDPHRPYQAPEALVESFKDMPLPDFACTEEIKGEKPETVKRAMSLKKQSKEKCATAYRHTAASIHLIDQAVGKIIHTLKEEGLYDDTIIVFTSDHGDYLGDLDMLAKSELPFMNLLNVPFMIKSSSDMTLPKVYEGAMSNVDVVPTLLTMMDLPVPDHIQGINIFDKREEPHYPLTECYSIIGDERSLTVFDDSYRYSYYLDSGSEELYDHRMDPKELDNLAVRDDDEMVELCHRFKGIALERHAQSQSKAFNRYGLW